MADDKPGAEAALPPLPTLEEMQHWTGVLGRAQQLMMEHGLAMMAAAPTAAPAATAPAFPGFGMFADPTRLFEAQAAYWDEGVRLWQRFLDAGTGAASEVPAQPAPADRDRRFAAPQWRDHPLFDLIRQNYLLASEHLVRGVDAIEGLDERQREQLRFAASAFADALSPSNFAATNPLVIERTLATRGENLVKGLEHMLADMRRGQLTHSDASRFELGVNIAATPGAVIHETPLYQLIHYAPTTETVARVPLVIFPPWINRFYILDLNPEKSFVRWAVAQGLSVFMVSWKSADESIAHVAMDDYVAAQLDAIDTIRDLLDIEAVHAIGYCVAGTTLAATLALLAARGQADKVASATFFTAQVDFADAGDLKLFVDDAQLDMLQSLGAEGGTLDGRYMAATFNLLRGRDLIWNYVVNNYLLGEDYPAFDLLHWNGDTTNLATGWHQAYLRDLYRDNKLVQPAALSVDGVPIDLGKVATPTYVQAGREDHIAPATSVWKITHHFKGPLRFVLAGSGHIAGVVNPPAAGKYQYWTNDMPVATLDEFVAGATEIKGSWWPNWRGWLAGHDVGKPVAAKGARVPGKGKRKAIEPAPGRYVKAR